MRTRDLRSPLADRMTVVLLAAWTSRQPRYLEPSGGSRDRRLCAPALRRVCPYVRISRIPCARDCKSRWLQTYAFCDEEALPAHARCARNPASFGAATLHGMMTIERGETLEGAQIAPRRRRGNFAAIAQGHGRRRRRCLRTGRSAPLRTTDESECRSSPARPPAPAQSRLAE
jgi:hypothetical protein